MSQPVSPTVSVPWQTLLDAIEPGVTVFSSDFRLIAWNRPYESMEISEPGTMQRGMSLRENYFYIARRGIFGPGDPQQIADERWEMARNGASPAVEDLQSTDGRIIEIRRYFLTGLGVAAVFTDVTEFRRAEARARQSESLAQLGRFAGGLAHDFNNLLTVVIGSLEVGRREGFEEGVDVALRAAKQGADLCRTALALSHPQSEQMEVLSIRDCLEEVVRFANRILCENVSVLLEPALSSPCIQSDRTRFCGAVVNLVLNARDALPEGGQIRIAAREIGPQVAVSVEDDGVGIDVETLQRIREPHFTTRAANGGTGLGLHQVQELVDTLGGELDFQSAPGIGTRVTMSLPTTAAARSQRPPRREAGFEGRALVVDDDERVRAVVARMLGSLGFTCVEVASAEAALDALESDHFDLLFSDWALPGLDGDELIASARAIRPDQPAILCTGYNRGIGMACEVETLRKPFTRHQLSDALLRVMGAPVNPQAEPHTRRPANAPV